MKHMHPGVTTMIFLCVLMLHSLTAFAALPVGVAEVKRGDVSAYIRVSGNAYAVERESLTFQTSEIVSYVKSNENGRPLSEGDLVKKGELLASLGAKSENAEVTAAKANLNSARASLRSSQENVERNKVLLEQGLIDQNSVTLAETEYEQAASQLVSAEAQLEQALVSSERTQLRASFDGMVAFINIREGEYFTPGQVDSSSEQSLAKTAPIVLINPSRFEAVLNVPAHEGVRVKKGQRALVLDGNLLEQLQTRRQVKEANKNRLESLFNQSIVASVSPSILPGERTIKVRLFIDDVTSPLIDGNYLSAWIEVNRAEDVLTVPIEALVFDNQQSFVFRINADKSVSKVPVEVGLLGRELAAVTKGIEPGQKVVTRGRHKLADGAQVSVVEAGE